MDFVIGCVVAGCIALVGYGLLKPDEEWVCTASRPVTRVVLVGKVPVPVPGQECTEKALRPKSNG